MDTAKLATLGAVIVGVCLFNFIPTVIAYATKHPERKLLASLNVLSLLSLLLWGALLVWAIGGKRNDSVIGKVVANAGNRRAIGIGIGVLFLGGAALTIYGFVSTN